MKPIKYLAAVILLSFTINTFGQTKKAAPRNSDLSVIKLTIEPGLGLTPAHVSNLRFSNVIQWNILKRLSITSYTAYTHNEAGNRNFNFIKTDYNYSLNQKFGIGTSVYTKHTSHTFSVMAGVKYDAYKETLQNPEFEKVSMAVGSVSPDFGLMYNLKAGTDKYFFSYRMYVPLYPYPVKSADINAISGNLQSLSLEFGLGFRLK